MIKDPNRDAKRVVKSMKDNTLRETVSTGAASKLLGVSPSTLRKWVTDGAAEAKMIGGQLRFSRDEVQRLFQRPPGSAKA
jgi:excisionase family DNA binding protein